MKSFLLTFSLFLFPFSFSSAAERVISFDELDGYCDYTESFLPGALLCEDKHGCQYLKFQPKAAGDYRKEFFPVEAAPTEREWTFSFRYRLDKRDFKPAFVLRFYFGDKAKPETCELTADERGSRFADGTSLVSPKEGDLGFLSSGNWNKATVSVKDGVATLWTFRGGRLTKDCEGRFPAKPLVGWNLNWPFDEEGDVRLDRVVVTDGTSRPYACGDLQECLLEKPATGPAWDADWGAPLAERKPLPVNLEANDVLIRFRSRLADAGKQPGLAIWFHSPDKKRQSVCFTPQGSDMTPPVHVFTNGAFAADVPARKENNVFLRVTGTIPTFNHEHLWTLPPQGRQRYQPAERAEILAVRDRYPKMNDRVWELRLSKSGEGRYLIRLGGQVLNEFTASNGVVAVSYDGAPYEVRLSRGDSPAMANGLYELPLPKDGFRLVRVRENMGSYMLQCNGFLSRSGFDPMPSSCLFNVPRRQWRQAKVRCRVDPLAPASAVPVITARFTQYYENGGRSHAATEQTVDLRKANASVVRLGDEYEITFDFDVGFIQDLTSMKDGMFGRELPYLHVDFLGPLWEKNNYYIDYRHSPSEKFVSNLVLLKAELVETPVGFTAVANSPFPLYCENEKAAATLTVTPRVPGAYAATTVVTDEDGRVVDRQSFTTSVPVVKEVVFNDATAVGHYSVVHTVAGPDGQPLITHEASFGRLAPDTRQATWDSPFMGWNFLGRHGTPATIDDWGPVYKKLGVRRTTLISGWTKGRWDLTENDPKCREYGVFQAQFPWVRLFSPWKVDSDPNDPEQVTNLVAELKKLVRDYPHTRTALVWHEAGVGPFPRELYGERTEVSEYYHGKDLRRKAMGELIAKAWRIADPGVKLIHGNSWEGLGFIAGVMREGYSKDYVDAWGEESIGMTLPPEISTAMTPWQIKKLAAMNGYTTAMDCPREWKARGMAYRYAKDLMPLASVHLRDAILALALGYTLVPVGPEFEVGNTYFDTVWGGDDFARVPYGYPRPSALAIANLTLLMDRVKYVRQLPTGSLSAYALEFRRPDGTFVYPVWTCRGETTARIAFADGQAHAYSVVSLTGRRCDGVTAFEISIGEVPAYILSSAPLAGLGTSKTSRRFRFETPCTGTPAVSAPLVSADEVVAVAEPEPRLEKRIGLEPTPMRRGAFTVRTVTDDEKGACLEVTHASQASCPELMTEYVFLKVKDPKPVTGDTVGVWAKGNSNWGRVYFEVTDAEGEKWMTTGIGGLETQGYDWPHLMAFNYDGWHYLQFPLTAASPVKNATAGDNHWQWTRDGDPSHNGKIDFPVRVTGLVVSQMGATLDLFEMKKPSPSVRLKGLSLW